jgi:hypothetical protein
MDYMKIRRLIPIMFLLLIAVWGCSGARSEFSRETRETYQWPHLNQEKTYARVLDWVDNNFYTPRLTVVSSNPQKGVLILKGLTTMNYLGREYPVAFKAEITVRGNRAEITYQDFETSNLQDRKLLDERGMYERLKPDLKRISHSLYRHLAGKSPQENEF